jgi:hypothetical protein
MAYEITPVSQQIKPVSNLSLADMVNIGRGVQSYKSGQIALEQQDVGNLEQRAIAEAVKADPGLFMTDNSLDIEKAKRILPQLAPRTYPAMLEKYTTMSKAEVEAKSAKQNLTQDQKNLVGQTFNILGKAGIKDKNTYLGALDDLVKTNPNNPDLGRLVDSYKTIWNELPEQTPWDQLAQRGAQTLLNISQQETAFRQQPGTIGTGAATFPTVTTPSVAGLPPRQEVGQTPLAVAQMAPGGQYELTGKVDMNNNPTYFVRDARGRIVGEETVPAGVAAGQMPGGMPTPLGGNMVQPQPQVPGAGQMQPPRPPVNVPAPAPTNAPVRMPAGETGATLEVAQNLRTSVRNSAAQAPIQQFNNNQIIKLADDVVTGKGANFVGSLTGGYALIPWSSDNATNLNQLGHYMAMQTASLSQSSGLGGTDAGRAIAGQISGTNEWTAPAIKQTARVNRALTTGTELFNQGIENNFNRTKNPFSATEFQQRWTQTLGADGINAVRLYDAMRNNDKEAIREVVTQAGGPNSPGYQNLVRKIGDMQKLIGGK